MAPKRIYLGIDSHSNLAISLEPTCDSIYNIAITEGARGAQVCKFAITEDALSGVLHNKPFKVECEPGEMEISSAGDRILFNFRRAQDEEPSSCALGISSFLKVLKLAHNRAYAS